MLIEEKKAIKLADGNTYLVLKKFMQEKTEYLLCLNLDNPSFSLMELHNNKIAFLDENEMTPVLAKLLEDKELQEEVVEKLKFLDSQIKQTSTTKTTASKISASKKNIKK